jgi:hypothetical protein
MQRYEGSNLINIDEILLLRRRGVGSPWREISYWKRGVNTITPPQVPPKRLSVAIVPAMTSAVTKGYAVYGNAANAWQAFNRLATSTGTFDAKTVIRFPEVRFIRGWALQFASQTQAFLLAIEGLHSGKWGTILPEASVSPINGGRFGAATTPMECTAVRILTSSSSAVRSCQFFDAEPLVPVTMTSNSGGGVILASEFANANLYRCFTEQSVAYAHGTGDWYVSNGDNRGLPSFREQSRFEIWFNESKTVSGFSVGGLASYLASNRYANCLRIEGRESAADFWRLMPCRDHADYRLLDEVEFDPSDRLTRYFDFLDNRTVSQLRITVQDVSLGASPSIFLPPMQVWGA